ncbi:MAG: hypothetical protein QOE28_2200 [Solirubrobacteraceae bacterium]|jgi:hypothetical protein|nr:hypothetical protein [Solirubrobacteraceae bacterium]
MLVSVAATMHSGAAGQPVLRPSRDSVRLGGGTSPVTFTRVGIRRLAVSLLPPRHPAQLHLEPSPTHPHRSVLVPDRYEIVLRCRRGGREPYTRLAVWALACRETASMSPPQASMASRASHLQRPAVVGSNSRREAGHVLPPPITLGSPFGDLLALTRPRAVQSYRCPASLCPASSQSVLHTRPLSPERPVADHTLPPTRALDNERPDARP